MEFEKHRLKHYAYLRYETSWYSLPKKLCMGDVANAVCIVSYKTMLTMSGCSSECCVPLDFEVASDTVVHCCFLLLVHQVIANK